MTLHRPHRINPFMDSILQKGPIQRNTEQTKLGQTNEYSEEEEEEEDDGKKIEEEK